MREHYIKLSPGGPRRLSALIKDWIKKRALTEEFLARFEEVTRHQQGRADGAGQQVGGRRT